MRIGDCSPVPADGSDRRHGRLRSTAKMLAGLVLAIVAGAAATVAAALLTSTPELFLAAGAAASAAVWAVLVWRYGGRPGRPRRLTLTAVGVLAAAGVLLSILLPVDDPQVHPAVPPGAGTWTLADGTHLAYGVVHARPATAAPVVVLHGGPGVPDLAGDLAALRGLTDDGHDVYAYAQLGAGTSSRLADPAGYTIDRYIADLEQVRQQIGAPRLILIGHSYGAFLAAAYLAAHPDRVARVVFTSPGSLRNGLSGSALQAGLDWQQRLHTYALIVRPRLLLTYALLQANPRAAHAFASDHELDPRMDRLTAATESALHCPGHTGPTLHGTAFYANQTPQSWHHPPVPTIAARLRTVHVPALILKGQCDYVDWPTAAAYASTIPDTKLAYLHGAGHELKDDQPAAYFTIVRAFLADAPVPHLLAQPQTQPTDYQPSH